MTSNKREKITRNTLFRFILWLCVLLVMGMIFAFSAQNATESGSLSRQVTERLVRFFHASYDHLPTAEQQAILTEAGLYVRKGAHFLEYTLLGALLRWLYGRYTRRRFLLPFLSGVLFAAGDELHQYFTPGRCAAWQDVALDSAGVLTGVFLASLISVIFYRIIRKRGANK